MYSLTALFSRRWRGTLSPGLVLIGLVFPSAPMIADSLQGRGLAISEAPPLELFPPPLNEKEPVSGEILVKFREGVPAEKIAAVHAEVGAKVVGTLPETGYQRVRGTRGQSVEELLQAYSNRPEVEVVKRMPPRM